MATVPDEKALAELISKSIEGSAGALSLALSTSPTAYSVEESGPPTPVNGPPQNYDLVEGNLYRSSFPRASNFEHLNSVGLKTIISLVPGPYPAEFTSYLREQGIVHHEIPFPAHKEASDAIPATAMQKVLNLLVDESNHPLLIHCNKGKHRTGCAIACYRLSMGGTMHDALDEYRRYAGAKARTLDERYIQAYEREHLKHMHLRHRGSSASNSEAAPLLYPYRTVPYPTPPSSDKNMGS